jgi:hypothetical protein
MRVLSVPSVKRAQGQLLKSGYLPDVQTETYERWFHSSFAAASISFYKSESGHTADSFKVEPIVPDRPEFDEFNSYSTRSISAAVRMGKIFGVSKQHVA